jgi:3-isopropylmalate dehydrogenase
VKTLNLAILAGDGVGSEIMSVSLDVLHFLKNAGLIDLNLQSGLVGGVSIRDCGAPITQETIEMVKKADAVLFGAVGDYSFDHLPQASRPEVAIL